ncbi:hypothetical protein J4426_00690 [Candidatus Woesearchaeota archaeon]|nr:hypothetical protein [Candidatus Woesearchaeota archaeon]
MNILIGVLIAILIAFIIFASLTYDRGVLTGRHIYESPKGSEFTFLETKAGDVDLYELQVYAERYGVEHLYQIPFRNLPRDVEFIPIQEGVGKKVLNARGVYITLDPNLKADASIGAIEIASVIGTADFGVFKIPTEGAFTETTDIDYSVKTCEDAKDGVVVINLRLEDENSIYAEGDCIIVQGDSYVNLIKSSERLLYSVLTVL